MTSPLRSDWDDERLAAAFAARAESAPTSPADLAEAVLKGIARGPRPSPWTVRRVAPALGAAAAITLAVIVGAGQLLKTGPAASLPPTSTGQSASNPSAPGPVPATLGTTLSVAQAVAVRDAGIDDREIAVDGFLESYMAIGCPAPLGPGNPTLLRCPASVTWLLDVPEVIETTSGNTISGHPPTGPSIQPSFAVAAVPNTGDSPSPRLTLVGHFDDRRAGLCEAADREACAATFVVDRIAAVNGVDQPVTTMLRNERWDEATQATVTEHPKDLEADVDRLVIDAVPGGAVLSRQLVTMDQLFGIEPVLAKDEVLSAWGNPATLVWIVTAVDLRNDVAVARTFALFDGSNWFAEVTTEGATMIERRAAVGPSDGAEPQAPSADPSAFDNAPKQVLGLDVQEVAAVTHQRHLDGTNNRDEYAIRAWYLGPNPDATCSPEEPLIHPPTPPCDEARQWLLDLPDQYGVEPGQVRRDPEQWPTVLNPPMRVDVPFDVPATWVDGRPIPQPVVVLGHFNGGVDAYHGDLYFVVDALAWTRDRPVASLDTIIRLTSAASEDSASVVRRIEAETDHVALATWMTVVDAKDLAALEPDVTASTPEFTSGRPVWIVRRLVRNEIDGRQRLAVERSYTADGGNRVWRTEFPDSDVDLATTFDLSNPDAQTDIVRVYDYDRQIVALHSTVGLGSLAWRRVGPDVRMGLQVARGQSDREIAIRWTASACPREWQIRVHRDLDGQIRIEPSTFGDPCGTQEVVRQILLTFDHAVDLDRIRTGDLCCG